MFHFIVYYQPVVTKDEKRVMRENFRDLNSNNECIINKRVEKIDATTRENVWTALTFYFILFFIV